MNQLKNLEIKTINHLGIIAGIIDEIGIVEIINKQLGTEPQEKVSSGVIIKAIILLVRDKFALAYKSPKLALKIS